MVCFINLFFIISKRLHFVHFYWALGTADIQTNKLFVPNNSDMSKKRLRIPIPFLNKKSIEDIIQQPGFI